MGTPFDPNTHSIILGADGKPVPQLYSKDANSGAGGFIVDEAYDSWDFDGQAEITIPAGSYVMESTTRNVNGYSTLAFILRCLDNKDVPIRIEALWLSTSGSYNTFRRATEVLHDGTTFAYSACGAVATKAENVVIGLVNNDTVDRTFHLHMFMR